MKIFNYSKALALIIFFLTLSVGLIFNTFQLMGFDLSMLPGDLGDSRLNNYFLEHCYQFFSGKINNFWDAPFMYPDSHTITYSENLLGTAPFYSIFRILGFARVEAYQFWFLLMIVFNYASCYLFLYKLLRNPYGAALGSFVFAFSLALQSQIVTTQMLPRFAIPLTLLMLIYFYENLQPKYFFFATFFVVYQFYCGIYTGFLLLTAFLIVSLLILIFRFKLLKEYILLKRWWLKIVSGAFLNAILLLILMLPYIERSKHGGMNEYANIFESIPTLISHFFSPLGNFSWKILGHFESQYPVFWLHTLFPGVITIVSFLWVIILLFLSKKTQTLKNNLIINDGKIRILIISSLLYFLFFLRIGDFSLYYFLFKIPGFGIMRNLCRMINVQLIFYAIALAITTSMLLKKNSIISIITFISILTLLVVDNYSSNLNYYRSSKLENEKRVINLEEKLKKIPKGSLISYEPDTLIDFNFAYHMDAMLASQKLGLKCVNGYTGGASNGFYTYSINLNEKGRKEYFQIQKYTPDTVFIIK